MRNAADFDMSLVNPHQRCGYSDSPFARIYFFLYCRVQKWVGGGGQAGDVLVNGLKTNLKEHIFHASSQALGPGPGPAKKDDKYLKGAATHSKKSKQIRVLAPLGLVTLV